MTAEIAKLKRRALAALDTSAAAVQELALRIHADPELSGEEAHARESCLRALSDAGYTVSDVPGVPTAFTASVNEESDAVTVGLLAEYDALPGIGHGCGHHLIAGATVGAGLALAAVRESLPGRIRVYGCPAEETLQGKRAMLTAGAFNGMDAALSFHAHEATSIMIRSTGIRKLDFTFQGRPSHAASEPWRGASALDGVLLTMQNVNALRQFVRDGVRIHGIVADGGDAFNVVPQRSSCTFGIRAADKDELERVVERVVKCAKAGALASDTEVTVEEVSRTDPVRSDQELAGYARANLTALGETVTDWDALASTDFGDISQEFPAVLLSVATWPEGTPFHSHEATTLGTKEQALTAMLQGARALALTAIDIVTRSVGTATRN